LGRSKLLSCMNKLCLFNNPVMWNLLTKKNVIKANTSFFFFFGVYYGQLLISQGAISLTLWYQIRQSVLCNWLWRVLKKKMWWPT